MSNVEPIAPFHVRIVAMLAGCFSATWGMLVFGWPFAAVSSLLIVGAIIQPRSPIPGKWLMWVGAFVLTLVVLPIGLQTIFGGTKALGFPRDRFMILNLSLCLISVLLVVCCDGMLVYGMKLRKNQGDMATSGRGMTWLVWVAALGLTSYLLVMSISAFHAYRVYGRVDPLLTWISLSLVAVLFDVALVVHAVKRTG